MKTPNEPVPALAFLNNSLEKQFRHIEMKLLELGDSLFGSEKFDVKTFTRKNIELQNSIETMLYILRIRHKQDIFAARLEVAEGMKSWGHLEVPMPFKPPEVYEPKTDDRAEYGPSIMFGFLKNYSDILNSLDHEEVERLEVMQQILEDKLDTYRRKNRDYGNSFDDLLDDVTAKGYPGELVLYIRGRDKLNRILALAGKDPEVKDEAVADTVKDLSNYADMYRSWQIRRGTS